MKNAQNPIDQYLAHVPDDSRRSLEKIRAVIHRTAPEAMEKISYQIPAYTYRGKLLVGFAAFKNHCTFFVMGYVSKLLPIAPELKNYSLAKSGIHFPADKPLPATLVRKIVKARMADIDARLAKTSA